MENILERAESSIPLVIVIGLVFFMSFEFKFPFQASGPYRGKQRWHNLGNLALTFFLNAILSGWVGFSISFAAERQFGLLPLLHLPVSIFILVGVFLCDLNGYCLHRLYHILPAFWRFHRVHHSDVELDATSALRLHPFEFILQSASQALILPLLGVGKASFVAYALLSLPLFILNHSNLRFSKITMTLIEWIFVTPKWHRIHHSRRQPETDSNFADVFTWWDRLFGTSNSKEITSIEYGLEYFRNPKDQTFWNLCMMPFRLTQHEQAIREG